MGKDVGVYKGLMVKEGVVIGFGLFFFSLILVKGK